MSLSLLVILEPIGHTQTNQETQKSQTCGATNFMAMGERLKVVSALRKAALRKDARPDSHLAKLHAGCFTPAAGTHNQVAKIWEIRLN